MGRVDEQAVSALVQTAGLGTIQSIVPIAGGANNRVFRVESKNSASLLKSYFRHPGDPRDRLATEFAFSHFAWNHGVRCIPQPLASDPAAGLGLFEFVSGCSLAGRTTNTAAVDQAIDFFCTLNRARIHPDGTRLPLASEACFSLTDHLNTINRRVERLTTFDETSEADSAATTFVKTQLLPVWSELQTHTRQKAATSGLDLDQPLDIANRCLSPSDFGYHNALLAHDGRLRFIDFEYAGWDDPSKLICDFFCQPAIPAPADEFDRFAAAIAAEMPAPALHQVRAALLLPAYRVKWVCIMLNEFLPIGLSRRSFSTATEIESRKLNQLTKAEAALAALVSTTVTPRKVA